MSCEIQPARHNHQPTHQQGTKCMPWPKSLCWVGWGIQFFRNDLPRNDLPYSKGFMKFGCPEPSKKMFDFWNFCLSKRRLTRFVRVPPYEIWRVEKNEHNLERVSWGPAWVKENGHFLKRVSWGPAWVEKNEHFFKRVSWGLLLDRKNLHFLKKFSWVPARISNPRWAAEASSETSRTNRILPAWAVF